MTDDFEVLTYRFIADYGPLTAAALVAALGEDAERVSATMARLLDAHRLVVTGVTPESEPLYAVAPALSPPGNAPQPT